jgi:outer membrane protein OmpA-like peptidoglycan-associated protein
MLKPKLLALPIALALALPVFAQNDSETVQPVNNPYNTPVYRINVVERTAKAINYRNRGDEMKLKMAPTALLPNAHGEAKVKPHRDRVQIEAKFDDMKPATVFGPEYLTYVMWAITPEGRPINIGEVQVHLKGDDNSELKTSTPLQAFGLIVTAEPYAAVTRPSNLVVLENEITPEIKADVHPIDARFEALNRGEYRVNLNPADLPSQTADERKQDKALELIEAENAIAIAKAADAKTYASDSLVKAQEYLNQAENAFRRDENSGAIATSANLAQQTAEDARLISIRKKQQEEMARKHAAEQHRIEQAKAEAEARRAEAQEARLQAQQNEQQRLAATQAQQQAEVARQQAEEAARQAGEQRQQAELARQQALAQQQQLAQQAEQARLQAQQAQTQAQQAEQARLAAERQVQETRERLMSQLNSVLQTRNTARGLIVNMSDVLFDVDKATLKPGAKVRLAKVAGILMAYPDLKVQVEGFTDSTGTEPYNQQLSEERARTVREFLSAQGVPPDNITSHGFGESEPIATNNTAAGRQMNRRVDLVVSGNAIGQAQTPNNGTTPSQPAGQSGTVAAPSSTDAPR